MKITTLAVCLMALLLSCSKDKAIEPSECFDPTYVVSFQNDVMPIVQQSCASAVGCHAPGATGRPVYTDYASLKAKVDDGTLEQRVLVEKTMPATWGPDSVQITDCEREVFRLWILSGAPNN